jgi:glycerophosphoryl diester phosphodiesterase
MKYYILITGIIVAIISCQTQSIKDQSSTEKKTTEVLIQNLKDPNNNSVFVIAHRGDWRNAPENSIQAIQNCIDMRVDAVELDLCITKDDQIILMHDVTLDRTTTGKGLVSDWTLDSLKTLNFKEWSSISYAP